MKSFFSTNKKIFVLFLILQIFFYSCSKKNETSANKKLPDGFALENTVSNTFAKKFYIKEYSGGYKIITVNEHLRYLIVPENQNIPQNIPEDMAVIKLPIKSCYVASTPSMSLFARLDALSAVKFCSTKSNEWYVTQAKDAMEKGDILFAGKYSSPDYELLLKNNVDIAVENAMIFHTPQVKEKFESLGIPVFVDESSYEEHPLGRVEWIKVYGLLFGKEELANSFFESQIELFNSIDITKQEEKKIVFFYVSPSGQVVLRGSNDYIVRMIELAGGTYAFKSLTKNKTSSPSVTISMEQFYKEAYDADFLIYNATIDNSLKDINDLFLKSELFKDFDAVKSGNVWKTKKNLYQSTDRLCEIILDINNLICNKTDNMNFLEKVK